MPEVKPIVSSFKTEKEEIEGGALSTSSSSTTAITTTSSSTISNVQLSLNQEGRRSAFSPYRPTTILTNLQRGNVQTQTALQLSDRSVHQLAAQGELFPQFVEDKLKNVNEVDSNGYSPLVWAAAYGQLSTVKMLLSLGADPNVAGLNGETALLFAASNGHVHVVKELLSQNVDVNYVDHDGNSALMYAANNNYALCVNELLKFGADITLQNCNLDTVYGISIAKGSKQVQIVLEKHILKHLGSEQP